MRFKIGHFLIIVLLFNLHSCTDERPLFVDFSKKTEVTPITTKKVTIKYAYLPQYSHTVSYQRHNPLIEYLNRETGLKIEQVFPETFNEHILMVGEGKIDISYSNPVAYVELANLYGAKAFARAVEKDGRADFRGLIIARADNPQIKRVQDCKGKRWIAVDPQSAGGYIFALGHFMQYGIRKEDFAEIAFAQGHGKSEKVVLAVHAGKYECGSVREGTLEVVRDKINTNEIRVLAVTNWYPGWVFAARKGLDQEVLNKIKKAMLGINKDDPEHHKILQAAHIGGIIPSEDSEFNTVRRLLRSVAIEPTRSNVKKTN
jgi:phosphonate transport system substrate-binding protein